MFVNFACGEASSGGQQFNWQTILNGTAKLSSLHAELKDFSVGPAQKPSQGGHPTVQIVLVSVIAIDFAWWR